MNRTGHRTTWWSSVIFLCLVGSRSTLGQTPQAPPVDSLATLTAGLTHALRTDRVEELLAISSPTLPTADLLDFLSAANASADRVVIRERARSVVDGAIEVILDVLVGDAREARLATWRLLVETRGPDPPRIVRLTEVGAIGGLIPLALDTTRSFRVTNLALSLPDFTLAMPAGTAFTALSAHGVTALLLLGRVTVTFTPRPAMEQEQVRLFGGSPVFSSEAEAVFIRLHSSESSSLVSNDALVPAPATAADVRRATAVFDDRAPRTFTLDLADISPGIWSLDPPRGGAVVEFRTPRFGWLTYTRMPGDAEDIALFDRATEHFISTYTSAAAAAWRRDLGAPNATPYDVTHYAIDVELDPDNEWIAGRATLRIERHETAEEFLTIKLAESLTVISVTSPVHGRLFARRIRGRDQFVVSVPDGARDLELDIAFEGALTSQPLEREAIGPLGAAPQNRDDEGVNAPTARFLYSTKRPWYPQGAAGDYATASLTIRVPAEFSVVASGRAADTTRLVARGQSPARAGVGEWRQFSFEADRPVRYLAVVVSDWEHVAVARAPVPALGPAAGSAAEPADPSPAVLVTAVATPPQVGRNRQTAERVARMLTFYAKLVGEAPFPTLTVAAADDPLPGGHAPAYLTLVQQPPPGRVTWTADPVAFDAFPDFFLAHEVAHQWWGQAVGWKTYHDQWISEGLAQYFAVLFLEFDRGSAAIDGLFAAMRRPIAAAAHKGPIALGYRIGQVHRDTRSYRAILYNKSAVVLDMLRRMVGDDSFFEGVRAFYREWRFRKAGTKDFQRALQQTTPLPLDRFFARWLEGTSTPRLRVTTARGTDGQRATIRVEQMGEVFDLPLDIAVEYVDGRTERKTLLITEAASEHTIALSGRVRRIVPRDPRSLGSWQLAFTISDR
jgi:hypothetical protein